MKCVSVVGMCPCPCVCVCVFVCVWTSSGDQAAGSQAAAAVVQQILSVPPPVIRIPAGRRTKTEGDWL